MKTFTTKEKRSAPTVRKTRPYVHHPMDPVQLAQRAEIHGILRSAGAQARLIIGRPNDRYEQEADRVADQVMAMPDQKPQRQSENEEEEETLQVKPLADQVTPLVQRQTEPQEEEEEILQSKPLADQITPLIQRQEEQPEEEEEQSIQTKQARGQTSWLGLSQEAQIHRIKGGGQLLPRSVRSSFEPHFGYDFSQVRVHTDARAAESARAVNGRAFTVGRDIVFGTGRYTPGTSEGRRLLAHELTHVVQQNRSRLQGVLARQPAGTTLTPAQKAIKAIGDFKKRTWAPQAFPGLDRATVAGELKQRVASPSLINQSGLPLCGPAAFAYAWASRNILAYVNLAVDLFENGKGKLGSLEISSGSDLRSEAPSSYTWKAGLKPAQADWMVLSSIRDWENDVIDFEGGPSETYAGGSPESDLIKWLRELGFSKVKDDVDRIFGDDVDDARKVDQNVGPGTYILLCVDAHMINPSMKKKGRANHWVVLKGNFRFSNGRVAFRCYTWGRFEDVDVTEEKFNATYYGAIIATA